MRLIHHGKTVLTFNETTEDLTVDAEFSQVKWTLNEFIYLSTFFARAENSILAANPDCNMPDINIYECEDT